MLFWTIFAVALVGVAVSAVSIAFFVSANRYANRLEESLRRANNGWQEMREKEADLNSRLECHAQFQNLFISRDHVNAELRKQLDLVDKIVSEVALMTRASTLGAEDQQKLFVLRDYDLPTERKTYNMMVACAAEIGMDIEEEFLNRMESFIKAEGVPELVAGRY
jgi:hypothetical protein